MDYEEIAKFKVKDEGNDIWDLPLALREKIHGDIVELLPEFEERLANGECPGCHLEEWPVTYMFDGEFMVVAIRVLSEDLKEFKEAMVMKFKIEKLYRLLEDQNE